MRNVYLLFFLMLAGMAAKAQTRVLTGFVRDSANNSPIQYATVRVQGQNTAATTGTDGGFSLNLTSLSATIEVSYVGYATQTLSVNPNQTSLIVLMGQSASSGLSEVVVTALGISKDARKIGYAVTTVNGDIMNKARETNVALSLEGRVAGLNVKGSNGGPGGTAKILLRGLPSITGAGAPLFVINGVPMDNSQRGAAGEWGGSDNGDGIGNLNPDDIETMTVLKGQSASALYGARAANGVILITTKSGKKGAYSIEYNTNLAFDDAMNLTDFQTTYGQGINGQKPSSAAAAQAQSRLAFGAPLSGGGTSIQYDGKTYDYKLVGAGENMRNFYRTGTNYTNTVAVSKGGDNGSFRLSLSNLDNQSIVRNSGLFRKTVNLTLEQKITPKLTVNLMANYVDEQSKNRAALSDGPMNANNGLFLAPNVDIRLLKPGYDTVTGYETRYGDDEYVTNPWFVVNQYVNNLGRRRIINSTSARYQFADWIYAQARVGYDLSSDRQLKVEPWGTAYTVGSDGVPRGNLQDQAQSQTSELNLDGLIGINKKIVSDLALDVALGGNIRKNRYERIRVAGGQFIIPYLYTLSNVRNPSTNPNDNYQFNQRQVNSAYYSVDLSYKNYLTLSTTGRYDVYSTLPVNNNDIFAPSVSASLIYSELLHIPKMDYGKLRVSYANTSGELATAYQTALYYSLGSPLGGVPVGTFSQDLPNGLLKPFQLHEFEVGTEARFFGNRLGFDVSYYTRKTENEIIRTSFSSASGFNNGYVPTGSTKNSGLEVQVTGTPVRSRDFNWNITANFTTVKNVILQTDADGVNLNQGTYRPSPGGAVTSYVKGLAGPQILAYDYKYDSKGSIIVDEGGLPIRGNLIPMGSVLPKYYGGLNNEFNYKALSLAFLIDFNFGNKILSGTEASSIRRGLNKLTLEGRNGVKVGVFADGTANDTTAAAQDYYKALAERITSVSVVSGDFIKFRQVTLGYTIPEKVFAKVPVFRSLQLSFVARNLFIIMRKAKNIDPEATFSATVQYAGIEGGSLPSTRTFGFNANFKFK